MEEGVARTGERAQGGSDLNAVSLMQFFLARQRFSFCAFRSQLNVAAKGGGSSKLTELSAIDELVISLTDVCLGPCIVPDICILLAPRLIIVARKARWVVHPRW
jgi:hypothetical protein